ncbi:protein FAR1-RELATED SEQUENCE 5-like [Rutidosis leptorrhynchoides]|uniref:protein FAR1-RELATED SEQUENCE 5-like n=1 Tax=Rutidosis leptorrhynchoides TaxID=125765 RepID=UPI003A99DB6B
MSDYKEVEDVEAVEDGEDVEEVEDDEFDFVPKQYAVGTEIVSGDGISHWLPQVCSADKPVLGTIFDSIDAGYEFYQQYAQKGGFEIRKSTSKPVSKRQRGVDGPKIVKLKYFVCSRQGFKDQKNNNNVLNGNEISKDQSNSTRNVDVNVEANNKQKQKRTRPSQRIGCLASFKLQIRQDGKYELYRFVEEHNHCLVHPDYSLHLKTYRRLDNSMKTMLFNFLLAGIGPTAGHRILTKLFGGHDKVGATLVDCRNWKRDIIQYIGKADAQIMIDMLKNRKDTCPNFSFEYFTDENNILGGFFWADDHAKRNYSAFGDVVSFDATYRSNKYKMVFIPFTGIDNHTKCVTFGAGMLSKENEYSYTWLLKCFKKAFPKEPTIVMTDQDPAMKKAVEEVFKTARHRLCMWHITEKLTSKVGVTICNSGFKARFSQIVWTNKLQPHDFEKRWGGVMRNFNLEQHEWLIDMYNMRFKWIPAYFLQWKMSGLMRTSSRSESENHMFGQLMSGSSTLVEFLSFFDTAMHTQRFNQSKNDHESEYTTPDVADDATTIEKDAAKIYTRTVFLELQKEIYAATKHCNSLSFSESNGIKNYTIVDRSVKLHDIHIDESIDRSEKPYHFDELLHKQSEVEYRVESQEFLCSCRRFETFGLLCRHIFFVLLISDIERFPKKYICRRWTRGALPEMPIQSDINVNQVDIILEGKDALVREIYQQVDYCVNRLLLHPEKLAAFRDSQRDLVNKLNQDPNCQQSVGNKEFIGALLGFEQPSEVNVHAPQGIVNKGGGKRTRITSSREKSIRKSKKPKRKCSYCKIMCRHDCRNCKLKKAHKARDSGADPSVVKTLLAEAAAQLVDEELSESDEDDSDAGIEDSDRI